MIRIENLQMHYRTERSEVYAVRDINRLVEQGRFYTLLGPSGCGKTSTLRCVAGLASFCRETAKNLTVAVERAAAR